MPSAPSPTLAALLSLIFPGAGQAYAGAPRRGLFLALPFALLLGLLVLVITGGPSRLLELFASPLALLGLMALIAILFFYHLAAVIDAFGLAQRHPGQRLGPRGGSNAVVGALAAVLLVAYGIPEYAVVRAELFGERIGNPTSVIPTPSFLPDQTGQPTSAPGQTDPPSPSASGSPTASPTSGPTGGPPLTPTPGATLGPINADWAEDGRLNLLLLGADAGPGRWSLRTDAIILFSVDIETGRAAFFGFPRNMTNVPLPPESAAAYAGGRFPAYIFGLWVRAMERPRFFPGDDSVRGWRAITGAIQELAGVPIDGTVGVNLQGYQDIVNELGGLWVDVPKRVRDDGYGLGDGTGRITISIKRGCQQFQGRMALAYARSRHQDSDYFRMQRQQVVLAAARKQFDPLDILSRVDRLLEVGGENLWLFIDRADLPDMAALISRVDADLIQRIRFVPPRYRSPIDDQDVRNMRTAVTKVFDNPDPAPTPPPNPPATPRPGCPP